MSLWKRDWGKAFDYVEEETFDPWERNSEEVLDSAEIRARIMNWDPNEPPVFVEYPQNMHLDINTKRAALKASPAVVAIQSHSGEGPIRQCSGFIIESFQTYSLILTTATLLTFSTGQIFEADDITVIVHLLDGRSFDGEIEAHDFHYNIAAVRIYTDMSLPTISLARLNDTIAVNPCQLQVHEESSPHSNVCNLVPGDLVIALGRFMKTCDIMAAPGEFSVGHCYYDCKELFKATCRITEIGIGGPLINRYGEAIGICLRDKTFTAFLPINIAYAWWKQYKKYGQPRRPWLGMEVANLYAVPVRIIERIIQKFPDVLKGVLVEEVVSGSAAESAGIKQFDVITEFAGKRIQSVLELFEITWSKVGKSVDLTVARASNDVPLHLSMVVDEATSR